MPLAQSTGAQSTGARKESQTLRSEDASMDEILASIRRIIAEDPIEPRHRFDRAANVPRLSMSSAGLMSDRGRADFVAPKIPQMPEQLVVAARAATLAPPVPVDDVLAELL